MGLTLPALHLSRAYVWTGWAIEPRGVRMHPQTYESLLRSVETVRTAFPDPNGVVRLTGMAVVVDRWLPPGVWRLTAADGSLLYDSRQGKRGAEW